jgi:hypothetical protein
MEAWDPNLVYGVIVVFIAGVIKGLTGFGFALVTVPVLAILLGPKAAVPMIIILNAVSNVPLYLHSRRWSDIGRIWPLIVAGVIFVPLGTYLLIILQAGVLKVIVGVVICIFAMAFLLGLRREVRREKLGLFGAGLISGTLNGLISTGGPPAILFLTNQGLDKRRFRASLITYFLFLNVGTIPFHLAGGLISVFVLRQAAVFLPALAVGAVAGTAIVKHVSEERFRPTVLVIVMATGVMAVLSGLGVV